VKFSFLLFWRYLFSKRSGSLVRVIAWINLIGVGLSVAALVLVTSVMNGFNKSIEENLISVQPHLIVHAPAESVDVGDLVPRLEELTEGEAHRIAPFETQDLVIRTIEGHFGGVVARGLDGKSVAGFLSKVWGQLDFIHDESLALSQNEVILGVDLARGLGIFEGDQISLIAPETLLLPKGEGPPVLKVTVKALVSLQNSEIDGNLLIYDYDKSFPDRFKSSSLWRGAEVFLKNPYRFKNLEKKLHSEFPDYKVQSWRELNGALFFALRLERSVMTSFLALAVLIVSFSLVTVLALLITQKRRDIGMMMAMGMSKERTHRVFTGIGLWLSLGGTLVGLFIGSILAYLMELYPINLLPDIYYDSRIPAIWEWNQTLIIFIFSLVLALAGSYLPLKALLKWTPTEALRKL